MREKDAYYRKAKKEGYRARSVYKLLELNREYKIIRKGDKVLDIGAAPGSWMQICLEIVGREGFVFGVDISPIKNLGRENAKTITYDIMKDDILDKIEGKFDVVISDVAPHTTGIKEIDGIRSTDLVERALWIAENVLVKRGTFLCKIFQSTDTGKILDELRKKFEFVKTTKPIASKKRSKEIYIIAKYFK